MAVNVNFINNPHNKNGILDLALDEKNEKNAYIVTQSGKQYFISQASKISCPKTYRGLVGVTKSPADYNTIYNTTSNTISFYLSSGEIKDNSFEITNGKDKAFIQKLCSEVQTSPEALNATLSRVKQIYRTHLPTIHLNFQLNR